MNKSTYSTDTKLLLTASNYWRIIMRMRYTFKDFRTEYPDDEACLKSVLDNIEVKPLEIEIEPN